MEKEIFNNESAPTGNPNYDKWASIGKEVPFSGGEKQEQEPAYIKLEDIGNICSLENCTISGHGTGSAGDGHEVVESIFKEGVKGFESLGSIAAINRDEITGSTDMSDNTVGLWSSGGEAINVEKLKDKLDHWPHRGAKNIILMRFPHEYFNVMTDQQREKDAPFFTVHEDPSGQKHNYIDNRFILGNYNVDTGMVELNEAFQPEIEGDFKKEMEERLEQAKAKTEARIEHRASINYGHGPREYSEEVATATDNNSEWDDSEITDFGSDEDWE